MLLCTLDAACSANAAEQTTSGANKSLQTLELAGEIYQVETSSDTVPPRPWVLDLVLDEKLAGVARGKRVCDVGTGTGILALVALKHWRARSVQASELEETSALALARRNFGSWQVEGQVVLLTAKSSELFEPFGDQKPCDLIISNPPQTPSTTTDSGHQGGEDGTQFLCTIMQQAAQVLASGGELLLVHYGYATPTKAKHCMDAAFDQRRQVSRSFVPFDDEAAAEQEFEGREKGLWRKLKKGRESGHYDLEFTAHDTVRIPLRLWHLSGIKKPNCAP